VAQRAALIPLHHPTAAYADAGRRRGERAHDILLWLGAFSPARRLLRVVIVLACMCIGHYCACIFTLRNLLQI
jgi:hypothetical protein